MGIKINLPDNNEMWDWVISEATQILNGEKRVSEKTFDSNTTIKMHRTETRIYVDMEAFGYQIVYSWGIHIDESGQSNLVDFMLENTELEGEQDEEIIRNPVHV